MIELLELCKAGKPPKMGKWGSLPMNGQVDNPCLHVPVNALLMCHFVAR